MCIYNGIHPHSSGCHVENHLLLICDRFFFAYESYRVVPSHDHEGRAKVTHSQLHALPNVTPVWDATGDDENGGDCSQEQGEWGEELV